MAADNFIYQGINRAVSDYTGARACEELINLRPTEGGLVPVRDFTAKFSNKAWERMYIHYTTSGPKYLAVYRYSSTVRVSLVDETTGDYVTIGGNSYLFSVTGLGTDANAQDVLDHLSFAAAGNIMLFSICAPTAGKYENHAFTWKMNENLTPPALGYVESEANVPTVTFNISATVDSAQTSIPALAGESSKSDVISAVQSGINAIQEENADLCLGPVIIAIAFKTTDGQTFWSGGWKVHDPIPSINSDNRFYLDASSSWDKNAIYTGSSYYSAVPYSHAYSLIPLTNNGAGGGYENVALDTITVPGTKVTLTFPQVVSGWNKSTSIIQSVEVYASKPVCYLDASGEVPYGWFYNDAATPYYATLIMPQKTYEDMDLGGQILYHQTSISMESLAESDQTVKLTFGGNIQMTEETLDTDAGALKRYGRVLSYNARFHYFDSVSKIECGMPSLAWRGSGDTATVSVFVRWTDDDQSELLYLGTVSGYKDNAYVVTAPSIYIKEVITCNQYDSTHFDVKTYRMAPSTAYNYSINTSGPSVNRISPTQFQNSVYYTLISAGANATVSNVETDAINVTEQYNPFVFRVEHSYKAPGNIIDVQPQMAGVVDASYGRDPLNVFTERGLYALTQGSANVLYGAFLPLSNLKGGRGGIPVEAGTFFLADGNLWLVSGRRVTLISDALSLGPHKYIRSCAGYKKLSGTDANFSPSPAPSDPVYDVSPYLSQVEFKTFVTGARLSYNRYRGELFISNASYGYSYVLSLKNWQWHKVSRRVWQDDPGGTIVNVPGSTTGSISILDMSSEITNSGTLTIHMQSRPFSMGYQYSHIHRIIAMMRAKLPSASTKVAIGLYGSDDLQHWNLLSYGKWAGKTEEDPTTHETTNTPLYISQMRTPSAARSWRYYTVCIGGNIPVSADFPTDIGPVVIDYEPVVRRLG